jgi:hypothetical protein
MHASFSGLLAMACTLFSHTGFKSKLCDADPNALQCLEDSCLASGCNANKKQQCMQHPHPSIQTISFAFSLQVCKHCTPIHLCFRESNACKNEAMYRYINLIWTCMSAYFIDPINKAKRREI